MRKKGLMTEALSISFFVAGHVYFKEKCQAKLYQHKYKREEHLKNLIIMEIVVSAECVLQNPNV